MITLTLSRHYVEALRDCFFPDINMYKKTRMINVSSFSVISEEYLSAVVINCVLSEIELLIKKKLINTTGRTIKLQLSDAQGVVLYKTLLVLAIDPEQVYFNMMRHVIIQHIDVQLTRMNLYQTANANLSTG